ncbi:hypothetical protein [Jeotgalibacillus haloalkalitolerans]|uniref:Short-chain dehydrogenase n=1 Tax=Jeotgalibacillus haloalkalitolerans TaxID=3104292 RepID=A0ABU5KNS5_9BACL|nr:hypothetical protein [Jeotgalibacillus sp. HH7-29]MDZ5712917.1 hypothetical protein [Jeotgalibacillus sp. HH7-29]
MITIITISVVILICVIGLAGTLQAANKKSERDEVSDEVSNHPVLFNPVIIIYSIAGIAGVGIILYYMI